MLSNTRAVVIGFMAVFAAAACGSDSGSSSGDCTDGYRKCPCPSGAEGVQLCTDEGTWGECQLCGSGAGGATAGGTSGGAGVGGSIGGASGVGGASAAGGDAGTGAAGASGAGGSTPGGTTPNPMFLPAPTAPCPEFTGDMITVTPAGIAPRSARLFIGPDSAQLDGPLIFYWHGTGSDPLEAAAGIGTAAIDEIKSLGGMVVAAAHDPAAGVFPWFLTAPPANRDDDLIVADEILACAIEKVGVDLRHIHVAGMSAGGLMTTQMAYRRSGYVASVVTYSGGLLGAAMNQDPANKFAAMIYHGGPGDVVVISFEQMSNAFIDDLRANGHFGFLCNHGMGHNIPFSEVPSTWRFMKDHSFGTNPSPYAGGLPPGFPAYCAL